ncbi:fibronectin type III domain-containing protein, partial [Candidatus Parcubacteria bacterium]|nr:fibronectin type III domain-containing protein [Candidatus Parcubacteria bacterium]
TVTAAKGASQTFTVTAAAGYSIQQVTVDGVNKGTISTYTFTNVIANHSITARFKKLPGRK